MAKQEKAEAAGVAVVVAFFYGDAVPGDTVTVDAEEAARLIDLGATVPADAPAPGAAEG